MSSTAALQNLFTRKIGQLFADWYKAGRNQTTWSCHAGVMELPPRIEIRLLIKPASGTELQGDERFGAVWILTEEEKGWIEDLVGKIRKSLEGERFDLMEAKTPYLDSAGNQIEGIQVIEIFRKLR